MKMHRFLKERKLVPTNLNEFTVSKANEAGGSGTAYPSGAPEFIPGF